MTPLEEADATVAETLLAWRLCVPHGEPFTGRHLLALRQLPAKERAYYAALLAPYEDPHAWTRMQTASEADAGGHRVITYTPPYPKPCACSRPVLRLAGGSRAARCSRCLASWPTRDWADDDCRSLAEPLIARNSVDRADIGYAIERLGL